jgi:peptidyl-prolyl cis-trans isomerase D
LRGPIGWTIAQVEGIEQVPGKSLAQARDEIAAALRTRKSTEGLANLQATIDDALTKNATFDEVLADHKLAAQTTPALLANGTDPLNPVLPANPALTPIVGAAFQAQDGDPPTLVGTGPDGSFAIVALGRVVPAAPRPFADIRGVLTSDMLAERARNAARQVANSVLAKVNGGASLSAALAQTGLSLPAVAPVSASRAQLAQNPRGAQPPLVLMFSMAQGTTRTLEAPDNAGWYIVHLDRIQPGDARGNAAIRDATRRDLGRAIGAEYVDQFVRAVRGEVGVKTNADALAKVRRDLLGQNGAGS